MRKLLNTLFVTSEDAYLALENENVVVSRGEERLGQYPLQILENIVSFSYRGARLWRWILWRKCAPLWRTDLC